MKKYAAGGAKPKAKTGAQLKAEGMEMKKKGQAMKAKGKAMNSGYGNEIAKRSADVLANGLSTAGKVARTGVGSVKNLSKVSFSPMGIVNDAISKAKKKQTPTPAPKKKPVPVTPKPKPAPVKVKPITGTQKVAPKKSSGTSDKSRSSSKSEEVTPLAPRKATEISIARPEIAKTPVKQKFGARVKAKVAEAVTNRREKKLAKLKSKLGKMKTGGMVNPNANASVKPKA